MCLEERKTDSRGRPPPARLTVRRIRAVRLSPRSLTVDIVGSSSLQARCSLPQAARSLLLALLAEDELARKLDALALVRLRRPVAADLGGNLADLLLVDAGHDDLGRLGGHDRDPVGDWIDDIMAVAERDLQVLALHRRAITYARDLQPPLEAFGDAGHHVGDERTGSPPQGARELALVARIDLDAIRADLGGNLAMQHKLHGALGALDLDGLAFDIGGDARRNGDRLFSDSRHGFLF